MTVLIIELAKIIVPVIGTTIIAIVKRKRDIRDLKNGSKKLHDF